MDLGNVLGFAADATGFGAQFEMAENLFDAAAPILQLAGEVAPLVALACPPAGAACAFAGNGAQIAQQLGFGNAGEKSEPKSQKPVQTMAKSEEAQPRSAERRETSGRERSETVRERHREPPVRDHRTQRGTDDGRPVRDHRTHGDERDERRVSVRRERGDDSFTIQSGDSFLLILAKALAGDIDELQGKIEADAKSSDGVADNTLISAQTQELAQLVGLANTVIGTFGQAEKTAAGQPA
jgi:hypothetical protein